MRNPPEPGTRFFAESGKRKAESGKRKAVIVLSSSVHLLASFDRYSDLVGGRR